jgi:hypothetical protein
MIVLRGYSWELLQGLIRTHAVAAQIKQKLEDLQIAAGVFEAERAARQAQGRRVVLPSPALAAQCEGAALTLPLRASLGALMFGGRAVLSRLKPVHVERLMLPWRWTHCSAQALWLPQLFAHWLINESRLNSSSSSSSSSSDGDEWRFLELACAEHLCVVCVDLSLMLVQYHPAALRGESQPIAASWLCCVDGDVLPLRAWHLHGEQLADLDELAQVAKIFVQQRADAIKIYVRGNLHSGVARLFDL